MGRKRGLKGARGNFAVMAIFITSIPVMISGIHTCVEDYPVVYLVDVGLKEWKSRDGQNTRGAQPSSPFCSGHCPYSAHALESSKALVGSGTAWCFSDVTGKSEGRGLTIHVFSHGNRGATSIPNNLFRISSESN